MRKQERNIFDILPDKKYPGFCFKSQTNICALKNLRKGEKLSEICKSCQDMLIKTINMTIPENMTLIKFLTLGIEERLEFIIKNKIWKKYNIIGTHMSDKTNKLGRKRRLQSLSWEDLTLGEIYFIIQKYLNYLKNKYIDNSGLIQLQIKKDKLLQLIENERQITEYLEYNTKNSKELNFKISHDRPKNTTLYQSLMYGKISDIKIIDNKNNTIEITRIPHLTIKNKKNKKLTEQVIEYINNPDLFETETNLNINRNKQALLAYLKIIETVEGACETNKKQATDYVNSIFCGWKAERIKTTKDNINIINSKFEIAPIKRGHRAIEKTIISYNGDISKSTDNCRGTIIFKTVSDLQKGMIIFLDLLKNYNNKQNNEQKKVIEVYFDDKYGNLLDLSKKTSGYRDGKFLIKLGDGNVIELILQIEDMYIAKNEGFETINNQYFYEIVKKLKLSKQEISRINKIIDNLDPTGTKRGEAFRDKKTGEYNIPHIEKEIYNKIPADFIYNIYRNLTEYNRENIDQSNNQLPFNKKIEERTIIEKLFLLEREIYQRGYKSHINKIKINVNKKIHNKNDNNLKNKLIKITGI